MGKVFSIEDAQGETGKLVVTTQEDKMAEMLTILVLKARQQNLRQP